MDTDTSDATAAVTRTREQDLLQLNEQYVQASVAGDVEWFRAHLADDFVCIESDGSVQFRDGFLQATALGSDLSEYKLDYVDVRFYGNVALVRASGSWVSKARVAGISRYTDVYVYDGVAWKVVSAQITRRRRIEGRPSIAADRCRHSNVITKEGRIRPDSVLSCIFAPIRRRNV